MELVHTHREIFNLLNERNEQAQRIPRVTMLPKTTPCDHAIKELVKIKANLRNQIELLKWVSKEHF